MSDMMKIRADALGRQGAPNAYSPIAPTETFKKILEGKVNKKIYMYTCSRGHQFYSSEIFSSQREIDEICVECTINRYMSGKNKREG
jgi:hypothetical protein